MQDRDAFYKNLESQLEDTMTFPGKYLYKFIVPAKEALIEEVENIFNHKGAVITTKKSKTGKYCSISVHLIMKSAKDIIAKYKEAEKVEGIISL